MEATSPTQYDDADMNWAHEGDYNSPVRTWMREYVEPIIEEVKPLSVLDVGSGTGWLARTVFEHGATTYVGIDPSERNCREASATYPQGRFVVSGIEDYQTDLKFDLIACLMATEHIDDLAATFRKWHGMLNPNALLLIVAAGKQAFTMERFGYHIEIQDEGDETVVRTLRSSYPSTTDIIRDVKRFNEIATNEDFILRSNTPMFATEPFVKARPHYQIYFKIPLFQLLEYEPQNL